MIKNYNCSVNEIILMRKVQRKEYIGGSHSLINEKVIIIVLGVVLSCGAISNGKWYQSKEEFIKVNNTKEDVIYLKLLHLFKYVKVITIPNIVSYMATYLSFSDIITSITISASCCVLKVLKSRR